ncbi:MAG: 6-carboxytetrahydropterin synthase [Campylobacterota bacterium]|nr:6-carboxytetrahydropterin synthase [Campylobacterota bacterium]
MKWEISKQFDFCYGHRVWSQTLNKELALDACLMCRHLHGHQGKIIVHLQSNTLNNGMVTDFKHLNWFKQFLDDTLDHKFIIDIHDPLYDTMLPHYNKSDLNRMPQGYYVPDLTLIKNEPDHIMELYSGYVIVDFVPTSENLSAWLLTIVQDKMLPLGIEVSKVEYYETPKSKSVVYST